MLKINNILLLAFCLITAGCRVIPEGTPPERTVEIRYSGQSGEKVTLAEAINLASTELSVQVFSGKKGEIRILFKNNPGGDAVTRRLYHEMKIFLPVKSVLDNENYILESSFSGKTGSRLWQVRLKDRQNKVIWNENYAIKDSDPE